MQTNASSVIVLCSLIAMGTGVHGAVPIRPDPRTPLATDGATVYAVAADRQTLLRSEPREPWQTFVRLDGADVRGLAWFRGRLFVSDAKARAIWTVPAGRDHMDRRPTILFKGEPLQTPADLTYAGALFILDLEAGAVFRLTDEPKPVISRVEMSSMVALDADTNMNGWRTGELLLSNGDAGSIAHVTQAAGPYAPSTTAVQSRQPTLGTFSHVRTSDGGRVTAVSKQGDPTLERPGAVATYNGVVYVVEGVSGEVVAAGIHDARPVRLVLAGSERMQLTRLLVTPSHLLGFDVTSGRAVNWPRMVPAEIRVFSDYAKEPMLSKAPATPSFDAAKDQFAKLYEYLLERRLLRIRRVVASRRATHHLDEESWWPGDALRDAAVIPRLNALLCQLNGPLCPGGRMPSTLAAGAVVRIPEMSAERFLVPDRVTLRGERSLGEVVDEAIVSLEFSSYQSNEQLRALNGNREAGVAPRDWRSGSFRFSREHVRYMAAVEAAEINNSTSVVRRLVDESKGALSISPLERVPTLASSAAHAQLHPNDPECIAAKRAFEQLLDTIKYAPGKPTRPVTVGVAETGLDPSHPDFTGDDGSLFGVPTAPRNPAAGPAGEGGLEDAVDPASLEPVRWRDFTDDDHANAVVSLIAGRSRPFAKAKGLAAASIHMLDHPRDATALAQDISNANNVANITVVNLSLKPLSEVPLLQTAIGDSKKTTLYVVSATNASSAITLCSPQLRTYPACWGNELANVLVVGATTLDGKAIHDQSPVGDAVHLFAPGGGYYAAGKERGYVRVAGTSFATALVSGAAAVMSGMGVDDPAMIRRRLIVTAERMPLAARPDWARLLNIRRAISHMWNTVVTDRNTSQETVVHVPSTIKRTKTNETTNTTETTETVQTISVVPVGSNRPIPLALWQIQRLTRDRDLAQFHIVYLDAQLRTSFLTVKPPTGDWAYCYKAVDANGHPTGAEQCTGDLAELSDYVGPLQ